MARAAYDRQGARIRVGYLVAGLVDGVWSNGLFVKRVRHIHYHSWGAVLSVEGGWTMQAGQCVVLEEPVWPNS